MKAKDVKPGDFLWAFEIRGALYEEEPILNCYSITNIEKENENQINFWDYIPLLDPEDTGYMYIPKNYELDKPIIVYYDDECIWCYGTNDKEMAKLYNLYIQDKFSLKNRLIYNMHYDKFNFIDELE